MTAGGDAFDRLYDAVFGDRNLGRDAVLHQVLTGGSTPVRAIVNEPDRLVTFGQTPLQTTARTLELRRSEMASLSAGDVLELGPELLEIVGTPTLDERRRVWSATLHPLADETVWGSGDAPQLVWNADRARFELVVDASPLPDDCGAGDGDLVLDPDGSLGLAWYEDRAALDYVSP